MEGWGGLEYREGQAINGDDPPWTELPPPVVEPAVEAWARALCVADGSKPDKVIGCPAWPRWCSYITYAERAIKASEIVGADQ